MSRLSQVIRFNPADEKEYGVIAYGNVVLSPGCRPYGYVLRELQGKFVTHMELYDVTVEPNPVEDPIPGYTHQAIVLNHSSFEHGHYFEYGRGREREQALHEATEDWQKRCIRG